jgi:hypothetical protein
MRGKRYVGYVHVQARAVATKTELQYWIRLAMGYNKHAKSSKKTPQFKIALTATIVKTTRYIGHHQTVVRHWLRHQRPSRNGRAGQCIV